MQRKQSDWTEIRFTGAGTGHVQGHVPLHAELSVISVPFSAASTVLLYMQA